MEAIFPFAADVVGYSQTGPADRNSRHQTIAIDETEYDAIAEHLEVGVKSATSFLSGNNQISDWLVEGDATDRELHALLKAQDPADRFRGLEKVQNKRREFLWVHPDYVSEY